MTDNAPRGWKEGLNEEKFAATVLYLLRGCAPARPGLTSLLKMIWFADYEHYRQHLRTITGGRYVALPNGPVLDDYKDLFESLEPEFLRKDEVPIQGQDYRKIEYKALVEPDETLFSEPELETLERTISALGRIPGSLLSRKTHQTGPWTLVWDSDDPGRHIPYLTFRWLDNLPDEDDLETARRSLARPEVKERVAQLSQSATD